jgi:hypothetical protein
MKLFSTISVVAVLLVAVSASAYVLNMPQISFPGIPGAQKTVTYEAASQPEIPVAPPAPPKEKISHVAIPDAVKAIYMSQCYASSSTLREKLVKIADTTEVNSIIIDIKDYTGTVSFPVKNPIIEVGGTGCKVPDMKEFVARLHDKNIYVIGRLTVFQDPFLTTKHPEWAVKTVSDPTKVWTDKKGLAFFDVGAKPYWDRVIAIARDAHDIGFDEINFDYIRFPSDGNMKEANYTLSKGVSKAEQVEKFFIYLTTEMRKPYETDVDNGGHVPVLSADLFGMTATNTDDLSIGQVLERAVAHFDFVAPMVYPSHYPHGFNGWGNPNNHVYDIIKFSMDKAVERMKQTETTVEALTHTPAYEEVTITEKDAQGVEHTRTERRVKQGYYTKPVYPATKLRTWIQDFDYGGDYGPVEVRAQLQATYDAGLTSWMIWSPSNRYTVEALHAN